MEILLVIYENTLYFYLCAPILLTRGINLLWSKVLLNFGMEVSRQFGSKNFIQEKVTKLPMIFELYLIFICPRMFRYMQIIYCWHVLKAFKLLLIRFDNLAYYYKVVLLLFSHLLTCTEPTILFDSMLQALLFC